jgi:hypothetical protein
MERSVCGFGMNSTSSRHRLFRVCWYGPLASSRTTFIGAGAHCFATAKVWATPDERWVYATISGAREARVDLTIMLRETLRALFAEYKNLSVVEQMEWGGQWVPRATLEKMGNIPADEVVAAPKFPGGEKGPWS